MRSCAFLLLLSSDPHSDFDCAMRNLGVQFTASLQPFRPQSSLQQIGDAFQGSAQSGSCVVSLPAGHFPTATSRFVQAPIRTAAGAVTVYVDPVHGSDATGDGTITNAFATLPPALSATRAATGSGDSIVIRAATIYNASTLVLTQEDAGLSMQSYPGEEAWISGGVLLKNLQWQPVSINSSDRWPFVKDSSVFHDWEFGSPASFRAADALIWEDCAAGCTANATAGGQCLAWTWFDLNSGGWSKGCWWRIDGRAPLYGKGGCVSARRQSGLNVWSASLAGRGIASIPGLRASDGTRLIRSGGRGIGRAGCMKSITLIIAGTAA